MGKYKILITKTAEKALFKLPKSVLPKILAAINGLTFDPLPNGCKKISGQTDTYRIRVQDYRILYEIMNDELIIKVLKLGHRKDIYRNL